MEKNYQTYTGTKYIKRKKTKQIWVGNVPVGGDAYISVQSMTNTEVTDILGTVEQIKKMESVGVDIARVACTDLASVDSLSEVIKQVNVPVVADVHFDYKVAIKAADSGAACIRTNPGNMDSEKGLNELVAGLKANNIPIRIGINGGSLERNLLDKYGEPCADAMVESAVTQIKMLEDRNFDKIKISVKSSDALMTVDAYRKLSEKCDYPLHLGVTEAGGAKAGSIKSAAAFGILLSDGIGDTLRVSLSADVTEEILTGYQILKSLGIRSRGVHFVSCPTCGRKGIDVANIVAALEDRLKNINTPIKVAVMGCKINGPGEAREAELGVVGYKEAGKAIVFIDGKPDHKIDFKTDVVVDHMEKLILEKVSKKSK